MAWTEAGFDADIGVAISATTTDGWAYIAAAVGPDHCRNARARLKPMHQEELRVIVRLVTSPPILSPQPNAAAVVHTLGLCIG